MTPKEINEAVARKLGWSNFDIGIGGTPEDKESWEGALIAWPPKSGVNGEWVKVPDYCNDIKAAWEVVEDKEFVVGKVHGEWFCKSCLGEDLAIADTAPMAICLAFLKFGEK